MIKEENLTCNTCGSSVTFFEDKLEIYHPTHYYNDNDIHCPFYDTTFSLEDWAVIQHRSKGDIHSVKLDTENDMINNVRKLKLYKIDMMLLGITIGHLSRPDMIDKFKEIYPDYDIKKFTSFLTRCVEIATGEELTH